MVPFGCNPAILVKVSKFSEDLDLVRIEIASGDGTIKSLTYNWPQSPSESVLSPLFRICDGKVLTHLLEICSRIFLFPPALT